MIPSASWEIALPINVFIIHPSVFLRMRNVLEKGEEKIKTHISCLITLLENHAVYEIIWKNFRAGQATDGNMAHAHWMLDT
jgi:hypothetical protein